jgi:hypothetical protein
MYAATRKAYYKYSIRKFAEGRFCVGIHGLHAKTPLTRAGSANPRSGKKVLLMLLLMLFVLLILLRKRRTKLKIEIDL